MGGHNGPQLGVKIDILVPILRWFQRDIHFSHFLGGLRLTCDLLATYLRLSCDLLATYLRLTCYLLATYLLLTCDLLAG